MKKFMFVLIVFCFGSFFVNAEDIKKEYYDETTDIKFTSPIFLEYNLKNELPEDVVNGAYYDALFYNSSSKFMIYTIRHCLSDVTFDSKKFSGISKEQMGKGVNDNEYSLKFGYYDNTKENPMAILGTYDENYYYYMVFGFPTMSEYYQKLVKSIVQGTIFGYKKNEISCNGNTGKEYFESDANINIAISEDNDLSNDKYYHPEEEPEEEIKEDDILDYEAQAREKAELEKRNLTIKIVISAIFLLAFVYITSSNKFEFSVFGMFFMIFQLAFIFLLDLNLIEGYTINYLYVILYVIPGFISVLLSTRKLSKKEVEN